MYKFAFLIGNIILAAFWFLFFFLRKDLRKQQIFLSLFLAPFAPLIDILWFYHDYWRPEYLISVNFGKIPLGLESPLFAFFVGGIAGTIYEVVFQKRHTLGPSRNILAAVMILGGLTILTLLKTLGLNTIWAFSLAALSITIIMLSIDKNLIKDAIFSGILITFLAMLLYIVWLVIYPEAIQEFWLPGALSGIKILKIPIEELVWFGSVGTCGGVIYEFWLGVKKYPKKH